MSRKISFVFCRYVFAIDEEALDPIGQRQVLTDIQGNRFPYGHQREDRPQPLALIMEPRAFEVDGETCLSWSVGIQPGIRVQTEYDAKAQRKRQRLVPDQHIRYADMIAVPGFGLLAVEDRSGDEHIPAKQAIGALRTLVRNMGGGLGSLDIQHVQDADVQRWLRDWRLTQYSYSVSPLNPITYTALAEKRSAAMRQENIAVERGAAQPREGQAMRPNGGIIQETYDLAEVGYGQVGFRGQTEDGHIAHVPKPRFHDDREKNLAEREKPHFVRVIFDASQEEVDLPAAVARALRRFYG